MKIHFLPLIGLLLSTLAAGAATLPDDAIDRTTQTALHQTQPPQLRRFAYLRYYKPTQSFAKPSTDTSAFVAALATYLTNMYVSQHFYGTPTALTLDHIGVLDGFELLTDRFPYATAEQFYRQHASEINTLLAQHLQQHTYPWDPPTLQEQLNWVKLLETVPRSQARPVYQWPTSPRETPPLSADEAARLQPFLTQTAPQARSQVILYDEPDLQLEDFDSHIGKRTYRWIKDECYYSSYLLAKNLTNALVTESNSWGDTHVYLVTATPKTEEFLTPAHADRFQLADGSAGLHWRYHTAVLVILHHNKHFIPIILDTFLAGQQPVPFQQWLRHFSGQTVFRAQPFMRQASVEQAIRTPNKLDTQGVWVDGKLYQPAKVLH